ncbi:MAG: DUF294 nucleotidyltransferase-like domain-containing protein [Bacteroidota bacterium]
MSNVIADRIAFFLKDYPPFGFIDYPQLEELALTINVRFAREDEMLFEEGQPGNDICYILRQGNVKLTANQNDQEQLIEQCEPGDVFGVRSLLSGNPYVMSATCVEESLVYELPKSVFDHHLKETQGFSLFFAAGYAAGQSVVRSKEKPSAQKLAAVPEHKVNYSKDVVVGSANESIQEVAQRMTDRSVGSLVITDDENLPVGIVTDTDLRKRVVAQNLSVVKPVTEVMSSPVRVIAEGFSLSEVLIRMLRDHVHHLVVTKDGTDKSALVGIVSDHDIMLSQQNHPAALAKNIRNENDPEQWPALRNQAEAIVADYLKKEVSVSLVSNFITEVNDTLIQKAIELALDQYPEAKEISFCWLSLGSEGREEQLLRTDQDNAIIFEDGDDNDQVQATLIKLAEHINQTLAACGFEECPANIMARNPKYCQPLSAWQKYFADWIKTPEPKALMNSTIFFDFRVVYGDKSLAESLSESLIEAITKEEKFLSHMAVNALQNPSPVGFFKKFLVERSGEHVDEFDIKKRAMMPLSDAARLLALQHGIQNTQNTPERYKKVSEFEPSNALLYEEAAQAYEILMRIRALQGIQNRDSGRFIEIDGMNKLEKQILRSTFNSIKDLQKIIEVRFRTAYFG